MISASTRDAVRLRAAGRCEYCGIPQSSIPFRFQIEHIIAKQHAGSDEPSNLALACERCNAFKGTNLSAIDPISGNIVPLFHPRLDRWHTHFARERALLIGLTELGRATIRLLNMNSERRVELRAELGTEAAPPKA